MKKILLLLLVPALSRAQESTPDVKAVLRQFIQTKIQAPEGDKDWYLQVNGVKLSKAPLLAGLEELDSKLKSGSLSRAEKKEIRAQFVQNYTDRMVILLATSENLLQSPDLDGVFLNFLAQAATQKYLEQQLALNPNASKPSDADIERYYSQNSARFAKLGLTAAQIREFAAMELSQTKAQSWTMEEVAKVKAKADIVVNKAVQREIGTELK